MPFVAISLFFCLVSHEGISTDPSGDLLLSVHSAMLIFEACLPLSHTSIFWPSARTFILFHSPISTWVSISGATWPNIESFCHVGESV